MSRPEPRLVVHVGQHKTGSKALQSFLYHNRRGLRDRGILYPVSDAPCYGVRAYAISQFRLYALVRREAIDACFGQVAAASYWRSAGPRTATRSTRPVPSSRRSTPRPAGTA